MKEQKKNILERYMQGLINEEEYNEFSQMVLDENDEKVFDLLCFKLFCEFYASGVELYFNTVQKRISGSHAGSNFVQSLEHINDCGHLAVRKNKAQITGRCAL